ncbi:cell wall-binding protein [Clostridium botulinum]|uniref:glycoside hydrolase family protein n=1 Tax=Clostridium botulinum TaxID=1491 RepID=UPI0007738BF8|nr:glycoside hydrolase family protein [Clostridium botulinum]NFH80307.1 cell wall-binding protein [Clostridium botulinum]NFH83728.1 cell wall-binding protein [Clostridium botulinum]NFI11801.1 cell wall-binding protein [Clostridium botulinum]NFI16237.1 cell wall-binding protein [Clostridium botulinum]NFO84246.1 cell wall-binding protein [Clostridium botulinum]
MSNWKWCVQGTDGKVIKGWYEDNGTWYYLNDEGIMQTGWIKDKDGRWYYLDSNGAMKTGWLKDKGKWYYLEPSSTGFKGEMYGNRTATIDGKSYTFDSTGAWIEDSSLVSNSLIEFIKGWEDFYPGAYYDGYGNTDTYLTIGYGTTKTANPSAFPNGIESTCSKDQATQWLKDEVNKCANRIKSALGNTQIPQNRFDCMVDIAYNAGVGSLIGGNTWKALISGNKNDIKTYVMQWNKANGQYSEGLNKRCRARVDMALCGIYNSNH